MAPKLTDRHLTYYIEPLLANYVGEHVAIRYDPRDMAEIRVYYENHFLCRAICSDLATETVTLKEIAAARVARRRELKNRIRKASSSISSALFPYWFCSQLS